MCDAHVVRLLVGHRATVHKRGIATGSKGRGDEKVKPSVSRGVACQEEPQGDAIDASHSEVSCANEEHRLRFGGGVDSPGHILGTG